MTSIMYPHTHRTLLVVVSSLLATPLLAESRHLAAASSSSPSKTGQVSRPPGKTAASKRATEPRATEPIEMYRSADGTISYLPAVSIEAGKPRQEPLANLRGKKILQVEARVNSRLVISYLNPTDGVPCLLLKSFGTPSSGRATKEDLDGEQATVVPFRRKGPKAARFEIRDPRLSPDGRFVLFKFYDPKDQFPELKYRLYVLDTVTYALKRITDKILAFPSVSWSPDGKFIAFVEGGDELGASAIYRAFGEVYVGPLKLYACEVATGRSQLVKSSDSLGQFAWTGTHSLLYGAMTDEDFKSWQARQETELLKRSNKAIDGQKKKEPEVGERVSPVVNPSLWEYSPESKKSVRLFRDGYFATPSPNGKKIAFFGAEDVSKAPHLNEGWQQAQPLAALSIADRNGSERFPLDLNNGYYPLVYWLSDNVRFLTFRTTQDSPHVEIVVKEWNILTKEFRKIADLKLEDKIGFPVRFLDPRARPLGASLDGKSLFVSTCVVTGQKQAYALPLKQYSVARMSLASGRTETIMVLDNAIGFDWQYVSE